MFFTVMGAFQTFSKARRKTRLVTNNRADNKSIEPIELISNLHVAQKKVEAAAARDN